MHDSSLAGCRQTHNNDIAVPLSQLHAKGSQFNLGEPSFFQGVFISSFALFPIDEMLINAKNKQTTTKPPPISVVK